MDLAESLAYLRHHLAAGRSDALIADDAAARLHRFAGGLPRALNNAATRRAPGGRRRGEGLSR
jgi:type II secretory pathway predicted ATPase ExeA